MTPETASRSTKSKPIFALGCVGVVAICLAAFGIADRARSMQEVGTWTDAQAVPTVAVVRPHHGPGEDRLSLPGTVSAYSTGTLFARASGYITAWHKDIGARVTKGEVLAEISAPDLDQQLVEAKAQIIQLQAAVEQAQANADLGKANNERTSRLVQQGWSSQALGDTDRYTLASRTAALAVAKANIVAQQAAVSRLDELARFKQVRAPFDGCSHGPQRRYRRSRHRRWHKRQGPFPSLRRPPHAHLRERATGLLRSDDARVEGDTDPSRPRRDLRG